MINKKPKKSKRPRNKQGSRHGYWEVYTIHGDLWFCGPYVNGERFGYHLRKGSGTYNNYYAR
jgi:hypothetical protein